MMIFIVLDHNNLEKINLNNKKNQILKIHQILHIAELHMFLITYWFENSFYLNIQIIYTVFQGQLVEVQVKDGTWFQGIYCSPPGRGFGVALEFARQIESRDGSKNVLSPEVLPQKIVKPTEIVQLYAKDITFVGDMPESGSNRSKFIF